MKKQIFTLLTLLVLCVTGAWAQLFSQDFGAVGAGSVAYDAPTNSTPQSRNITDLAGIVGNGSNLFTSIACSIKKGDIAINSATGGNNVNATGIFQVYSNGDNAGYWSINRTSNFAVTAPTALKVSMDIYYKNLGSGSENQVQFAIGSGFANGLTTTCQATANVHSGFGIYGNSTATLTGYEAKSTSVYGTGITQSEWLSITWVINNTGDALTYDNPTGSGTTSLNNDCFDLWLKTQTGLATTYTKIASNVAATTATKDLQNLYIGNKYNKKHEFRLDNLVITDLSPATGPSISSFAPSTGAKVKTGTSITITGSTGSTVYYKWADTAQDADAIYDSGSGTHGTADAGTAETTVESGKTLYAIARKDGTNSAVSSATYTIDDTAPTLSSSTPANGATDVELTGNITITFNENITIKDASKFTLTGGAGTLDTGSASVSDATVTIPYSGLAINTNYTISTAAGAVKDEAENENAALSDITFTTIDDTTAPSLVSSTPADNATGITSTAEASFTFDEDVVLVGSFAITPNTGVTIGTPQVSGAKITVPLSGLSYGTNYTLSLAADGIEDAYGNAYTSVLSKSFTTLDAPAASKTWDFTQTLSSTDNTNLAADITNWTDDSSNNRYKSKGSQTSSVLMANSAPVERTNGLLFTTTANDQIRLGNGTFLMLKNAASLIIPNLKANDEIIITFCSGNDSQTRTLTVGNTSKVSGSNSATGYTNVTSAYKVTANGNVTITVSDWMRIFSISVGTNSDNAVKVTAANYATFVTAANIDFSKSAGVTAYKAEVNGDVIELTEVTAAPENTPLIIAATSDSYLLTVAGDTPATVTDNDLVAGPVSDSDGTNYYVLGREGDKVGFGLLASGVNLPATKAYIPAAKFASARAFYAFDENGETTGIGDVRSKMSDVRGEFYNLAGQKVAQPTKGLYIVNGKKVVLK